MKKETTFRERGAQWGEKADDLARDVRERSHGFEDKASTVVDRAVDKGREISHDIRDMGRQWENDAQREIERVRGGMHDTGRGQHDEKKKW